LCVTVTGKTVWSVAPTSSDVSEEADELQLARPATRAADSDPVRSRRRLRRAGRDMR
jgi:hypothetical protein